VPADSRERRAVVLSHQDAAWSEAPGREQKNHSQERRPRVIAEQIHSASMHLQHRNALVPS
jgi:hypothetical protein